MSELVGRQRLLGSDPAAWTRYGPDSSDADENDVMPGNVSELATHVVGHRIVKAEEFPANPRTGYRPPSLILTLDNGKRVTLEDSSDCCAYTYVEKFFLDPTKVDHVITGVATTEGFTKWHVYADFGDVLQIDVAFGAGSGYYGYGFYFEVTDAPEEAGPMAGEVFVL